MIEPEFPKEFYKHCPKVLEAKAWYKKLAPEEVFVEAEHAECAFNNAGFGKKCENCNAFLRRPFLGHKVDEEFLPLIEKFYDDLEAYEKSLKKGSMRDDFCEELNLDGDELAGLIIALRWFNNTNEAKQQVDSQICLKTLAILAKLETRYFEVFKESL